MNSALTKEKLAQILDQALQDVTERTAGVRLQQEDMPPPGGAAAGGGSVHGAHHL